jgi:hemerythrin-like domain-containing protein
VLTSHHTGEDEGAFPVLAARIPELRPVLAELERDHHIVADGLRDLQRLVDGLEAGPAPDPARFRSEIDTLAALLETHLTHEERKIVPALNSLGPNLEPVASAALARATTLAP